MANWSGTLTNTDSVGTSTGLNAPTSLNDTTANWPNLTNQTLRITAGLGAGQERTIQSNNAITIVIDVAWSIIPDTSSQYEIVLKLKNQDHITGILILSSGMITELEDNAIILFDGNYSIQFQNNVTVRWNKTKNTLVTFQPNLVTIQGKASFWQYIYCLTTCTIYPIQISYIKIIDATYGILAYASTGIGDGAGIHHIWTKNLGSAFFSRSNGTDTQNVSISYLLNEDCAVTNKLLFNTVTSNYTERYDRIWSENCFTSGITWGSLTSPLIQIVKNAIFKNSWQDSISNIRANANKRIFLIDSYFSTKNSSGYMGVGSNVDTAGKTYLSRNVSSCGREIYNVYAHAMSIISRFNDYIAFDPVTYWAFDVTAATEITSDNDYISGRLQADPDNIDTTEATTSTANPQQYRGLTSPRTNAKAMKNRLLEIDNIVIDNILSTSAHISFDCKNSHSGTLVDQNSNAGQKILYVIDTSEFEIYETIEIAFGSVRAEENEIESIQDGISLTLKQNLIYTHSVLDADTVRKQLRNWGLPFIQYGTSPGEYIYKTPVPHHSYWGAIYCGFQDTFFGKTYEWKKWGHSIILVGLKSNMTYYVKCYAYTPLGDLMESSEFSFTTQETLEYTDPGIGNVREGTTYKFDSIEKIGIVDLPIPFDVRDGILYDNATKEGTLDLPIPADVRLGTIYDNGTKTGELQAGISQADIDKIADAVWDEASADHINQNSFGGRNQRIVGLMQENFRLYDTVYINRLLTEGRIRIYPSSADVDADTNPIATYEIEAQYHPTEGTLTEYKAKKI